jgi:hypothetical protein
MQLYTREDLLKRAWIADSKQADLMIDAIAASYSGDVDQFNCLMNGVANLHWLSETLKCTDPSSTKAEEVQQATAVPFFANISIPTFSIPLTFTLEISVLYNGVPQTEYIVYSTLSGDTKETVVAYFITTINSISWNLEALVGGSADTFSIFANDDNPIAKILTVTSFDVDLVSEGTLVEKVMITETPVGRCLTDEQIQGIVLNVERIIGSLCGCDVNELINDVIPDIIKYTDESIYPQ